MFNSFCTRKMAVVFCNENNIVTSLKYISSELEVLGYPQISFEEDNERKVFVRLINITWAIISKIKILISNENQRTVELAKLKSQITSYTNEKSCFERLLIKEKDSALTVKESLNTVLSEKKDLNNQLLKTKVEVKNLKKSMEKLNLQFGKEILLKENVISSLKEKLSRFVNGNVDDKCDVEENLMFPQFSYVTQNYPKLDRYINCLSNNVQMLILENANFRNLILKILIQVSIKCDIKSLDEQEFTHYLLNLSGEGFVQKLDEKLQCILGKIRKA